MFCGTSSETTTSVRANANTASLNASSRLTGWDRAGIRADSTITGAILRRVTRFLVFTLALFSAAMPAVQQPASGQKTTILRPARVFDGDRLQDNWQVVVRGQRIDAAGPVGAAGPTDAAVVDLPGLTLMPGLIDAHSHVLLHAYNEASWNDQVLLEAEALRV